MKNYFLFIIVILGFNFNTNAQQAGTLNNQFSQDGWDDSVYGNDNGFTITKTIIQPDGKILVCAEANFNSEGHQAAVTRYNSDGTVDSDFGGGDGTVRSKDDDAINLYTRAYGMALQSNGKIIIAGDQFYNSERIFRLNADGSYDTSFGTDGVIDMERSNSEFIYHVAVQSDNKIVVCGSESRFVNGIQVKHVFLWRFTENGVLDATFGNSGVVSYINSTWLSGNEIYLRINDLIILPDDTILVNQSYTASENSYVMLRKLNANGTLDTSFGTNGEAIRSQVSNDGTYKYSSSSVQQNGSIVTSFTSRDVLNSNYTESLFRINAQGIIDSSFNINLGNPTIFPETIHIIASGEKIYVFKKATEDFSSFDQINCYNLNGNPITSFGNNGIAVINQNNIPISEPSEVAVSQNGNIYLASTVSNPSLGAMFFMSNVFGFDANLTVDSHFSTNEITVFPNPTKGIISISNAENTTIDTIEIVDLLGKTILVNAANTSQIDLNTFSDGTYILKVYSGSSVFQKKIIKQ